MVPLREQCVVSLPERETFAVVETACQALGLPAPQQSVSRWGFEMDILVETPMAWLNFEARTRERGRDRRPNFPRAVF